VVSTANASAPYRTPASCAADMAGGDVTHACKQRFEFHRHSLVMQLYHARGAALAGAEASLPNSKVMVEIR
jgi:hypothetical protein